MSELRRCDDHGFHEGECCPACDERGALVCSPERRRRLSKFVSGALRHFPDDAGLELDDRGWTEFGAVVDAITTKYDWADRETLLGVVATDPKGRFEVDGTRAVGAHAAPDVEQSAAPDDEQSETAMRSETVPEQRDRGERSETVPDRIRAAYGHSVDVDLEPLDDPVPDVLYHGTAPDSLEAIRSEGIKPMSRQLVHLSGTVDGAASVGARHADDPIVLRIDAASMQGDGNRITKRGVDVYTTEHVPPTHLDGQFDGIGDANGDETSGGQTNGDEANSGEGTGSEQDR